MINNILKNIKESELTKFYKTYLKKYFIFRIMVNFIFWRLIFTQLFKPFIFLFFEKYKTISLSNYIKHNKIKKKNLYKESKVKKIKLQVINLKNNKKKYYYTVTKWPSVDLIRFKNVNIIGKSDLIFQNKNIIHHDFYNFKKDYLSEELHLKAKYFYNNLYFSNFKTKKKYHSGAVFAHSCSSNFFHWTFEVLPKIYSFCKLKEFSHIPIFVDKGLHKNIYRSLKLICGKKRKIFYLNTNHFVSFNEMYYVTPPCYVPFEPRYSFISSSYPSGIFHGGVIKKMREEILKNMKKSKKCFSKIYLNRSQGYRKACNQKSLINFFKKRKFFIFSPEKYSFDQQVSFFNKSLYIYSSTGAALSNIIFCKNRIDISIFFPDSYKESIFLWKFLSNFLNLNIRIFLCKSHWTSIFNQIHADYKVNIKNLKILINN